MICLFRPRRSTGAFQQGGQTCADDKIGRSRDHRDAHASREQRLRADDQGRSARKRSFAGQRTRRRSGAAERDRSKASSNSARERAWGCISSPVPSPSRALSPATFWRFASSRCGRAELQRLLRRPLLRLERRRILGFSVSRPHRRAPAARGHHHLRTRYVGRASRESRLQLRLDAANRSGRPRPSDD